MGGLRCLLFISHQKNITKIQLVMRTTRNTAKNQKYNRKMRDEII